MYHNMLRNIRNSSVEELVVDILVVVVDNILVEGLVGNLEEDLVGNNLVEEDLVGKTIVSK